MPTYAFKCPECGTERTAFMTIGEYDRLRGELVCCGAPMVRHFTPDMMPTLAGMVNDRHYDGLRAPDGTDIGSRKKHRDYLKRTGLATADDFSESWAKAAEKRREVFSGEADKQDRIEALRRAVETTA